MFGNRGIYHKGWTAVTKHGTPWDSHDRKTVALDDDVWELYDTTKDWSQAGTCRSRCRKTARAAAAVADRGDTLQGAAYR